MNKNVKYTLRMNKQYPLFAHSTVPTITVRSPNPDKKSDDLY